MRYSYKKAAVHYVPALAGGLTVFMVLAACGSDGGSVLDGNITEAKADQISECVSREHEATDSPVVLLSNALSLAFDGSAIAQKGLLRNPRSGSEARTTHC